jgi:hypothetical protein
MMFALVFLRTRFEADYVISTKSTIWPDVSRQTKKQHRASKATPNIPFLIFKGKCRSAVSHVSQELLGKLAKLGILLLVSGPAFFPAPAPGGTIPAVRRSASIIGNELALELLLNCLTAFLVPV